MIHTTTQDNFTFTHTYARYALPLDIATHMQHMCNTYVTRM